MLKRQPILGYPSINQMCRAEKITKSLWLKRRKEFEGSDGELLDAIKSHWFRKKDRRCKSILWFESINSMCRYYGFSSRAWGRSFERFPDLSDRQRLDYMLDKQAPKRNKCAFKRLFFDMTPIMHRGTDYN